MQKSANHKTFRRANFLGVPLCAITTEEFVELVVSETSKRRQHPTLPPFFVTYLNAYCSNLSQQWADYRQILCDADLVYADGQALVWASRWIGDPVPERVNAGDFFIQFCQRAARHGLRVFLLGSAPGVAAGAAGRLKTQVPELDICGTHHGFFSDAEDAQVIADVRNAAPDILIVGMGVPRQERWAWQHRHQLGARTIWCVGALFEYYSGYRWRAPLWMRKAGLEWFFRLLLEPRRLWRRYLFGNVIFLWRVARTAVQRLSFQ
jgi:N-acetylglucosaminyldiphosphoundecaprenol N-acetyl-beta-D-mannosaminyltransferase